MFHAQLLQPKAMLLHDASRLQADVGSKKGGLEWLQAIMVFFWGQKVGENTYF